MSGETQRRHESMRTHGNRHGYRGVYWDAKRGKFCAEIWPQPGVRKRLGRFDTVELAAGAYDEAARFHHGDAAYLNFPLKDERGAERTRRPDGQCPNRHDLSEHGYQRPDGRGVNCRKCNSESAKRAYCRRVEKASQTRPTSDGEGETAHSAASRPNSNGTQP